ncbi:hypothetical protein [Maricaulis sp.]|uniref:hypothetical protein n=1 Tax=Maricaulis sp. TaxID=1486257 RepID=UPI001B276C86|nr:hypothetical protein [Maricaulis sp.]MBO6796531.1 hypothetical protein [Maricaulis sp.]
MKLPSLPDWAFFPLSALVIAAMVYSALQFGSDSQRSTEEILAEGIVVEGDLLQGIVTGPGLAATFLDDGNRTIARIIADRGPLDGPQSAGAFITLAPNELEALQGYNLTIRYRVRRSPTDGAAGLRTAFFVPGMSQNDWQYTEVDGAFQDVDFQLTPPACAWDFGWAGMWPDWDDGGNSIDVVRIEVIVGAPADCS